MASRGYAALPAYQYPGNAMINFQPITQAVDKFRAGMDQAYVGDIERKTANAMAAGDYQTAQAEYSKIDPRTGMEIGMNPGRREAQDIDVRMKAAQELGGRAQAILDMPDGPEKVAAAGTWLQSDPRFQATFEKRGMTNWREDPISVVRAIHGEALGALDPTKRAGQYGLNPIYGERADGSLAIGQLNNRGGMREVQFPPGFTPKEPPKIVDAGTHQQVIGGRTGAMGPSISKNNEEAARQKKVGTERGEEQAGINKDKTSLEGATARLDDLERAANEVLKHPGLISNYGLRGVIPNIPGTQAGDAQAKLTELKAKAGFAALQAMRDASKTGGALGQVTETEHIYLQNSLVALEKAQSYEQVQQELRKLMDWTQGSKQRLQAAFDRMHGNPATPPPASNGWRDLGNGVRIREKP